jgi:hypothetical protein
VPNQRAKNKIYLGGFVDKGLKENLIRNAKRAGMEGNTFGFATALIQQAVNRQKRRTLRKRSHAVKS